MLSVSRHIKNQLVQHLIPVPITLRPLLCYILLARNSIFSRAVSLGNTLFVLCDFPVLTVQPFYDVVVYIILRISPENWKKELTSSQLFSQLLIA